MGHETAILRLDRPVPGLDHTKAMEPAQLCSIIYSVGTDAQRLNLDLLKTFGIGPGQKPRWWPASDALKTVRGLIEHYESQIACGADSLGGTRNAALPRYLAALRQLETVLDKADTYDRRFYFAVK